MKFTVLGSGAGLPSKDRNTQSFVIDCVLEYNEYILIDAGEALQHRILHTHIKPSKIKIYLLRICTAIIFSVCPDFIVPGISRRRGDSADDLRSSRFKRMAGLNIQNI